MTPSTYYISRSNRKKRQATNFYDHPVVTNNYLTAYSELNHITPPSLAEIQQAHLRSIKNEYILNSAKINKVINNVNADFLNPLSDFHNEIQAGIDRIDKALNNKLTNHDFTKNTTNVKDLMKQEVNQCQRDITSYRNVLRRLQSLYSYLVKSPAYNDSKIQEYAAMIEAGINELKTSVNSYGGIGPVVPIEAMSKGGYFYELAYLRARLQGRYYEVMGINYFGEKLAKVGGNFRIVDTANALTMHYDIASGFTTSNKLSGSDAFVIDSSIKINVNGKTMTIGEYLDSIQAESGSTTIGQVVTAEQLENIKVGLVSGIQIKSGMNQAIFNSKETSLSAIVATASIGNRYARALQLLTNLVTTKAHTHPDFFPTHNHYNALFNYCLARHLNYIIGKENTIVFTRYGCQTIYNYMLNQYHAERKLIQATNSVNIFHPNKKIQIGITKGKETI